MRAIGIGAVLLAAALVAGCGSDAETKTTTVTKTVGAAATAAGDLPRGGEHVDLASLDLSATVDHPYWPMRPGSRWVYSEVEDGEEQRVEVVVTDEHKQVDGIDVLVVRDTVTSKDGALVEDTRDWYAQDRDGNLWYLGEDTAEYEDGKVASREGSWEAGKDGAEAGIILPAEPAPGMEYREEYYEGHAEDNARILSIDELTKVPFRSFTDTIMTRNSSPIEPHVLEYKHYAKGVGPVLELLVSGGEGRTQLLEFTKG
jgi:hypothetical protein